MALDPNWSPIPFGLSLPIADQDRGAIRTPSVPPLERTCPLEAAAVARTRSRADGLLVLLFPAGRESEAPAVLHVAGLRRQVALEVVSAVATDDENVSLSPGPPWASETLYVPVGGLQPADRDGRRMRAGSFCHP